MSEGRALEHLSDVVVLKWPEADVPWNQHAGCRGMNMNVVVDSTAPLLEMNKNNIFCPSFVFLAEQSSLSPSRLMQSMTFMIVLDRNSSDGDVLFIVFE